MCINGSSVLRFLVVLLMLLKSVHPRSEIRRHKKREKILPSLTASPHFKEPSRGISEIYGLVDCNLPTIKFVFGMILNTFYYPRYLMICAIFVKSWVSSVYHMFCVCFYQFSHLPFCQIFRVFYCNIFLFVYHMFCVCFYQFSYAPFYTCFFFLFHYHERPFAFNN